nr:MAG TPA: hypothetical protein [Caudoviricetes sp.]DAW46431.1 MAG TPA: hypothetical protein [Caudoviricetes sp.]
MLRRCMDHLSVIDELHLPIQIHRLPRPMCHVAV